MKLLSRAALAAACVALASSVFAQSYPTKPIRVIVPFPAGGGTDIIAREVTHKLSSTLGWTIVVENKPGSGGNIGIDAVAKSAPDGYTLALGQTANLSINPSLYSKMPYDSIKDLAPVASVAVAPMVLVTSSKSPYKTLADVVNASKTKPESINIATSGNGTVGHLGSESFQKAAGIKLTHVPYKGAAQAITDVIGGQVELYIGSVPTVIGHIQGGRMRAIAVTSLKRVDDIPQVPTVAESGYKGFEAATWFGFVAAAGTPKDVITRLNTEINKALVSDEVKKKLSDQGADMMGGTPEQFGALIKSELTRWAPIIKESGATLD